MKKLFPYLIISLICNSSLNAQMLIEKCATDYAIKERDKANPGYLEAVNKTFDQVKIFTEDESYKTEDILRVPVVVHLVYDKEIENLSDELIRSQIDVINEDFNRLNADTSETRSEFLPVAGNPGIEFYLAEIDPNGNPTSGITRTLTTVTSTDILFGMDNVKFDSVGGKNAWDTEKYLNIWVTQITAFGFPGVLGFAYPPAGTDNWPAGSTPDDLRVDGIVIHYEVMGRHNPLSDQSYPDNNLGRTCSHEIGHYLGLRHIWADGDCSEDDGFEDTPTAASQANNQCDHTKNTCADTPTDHPDMIENFMDYAPDGCSNLFTIQQAAFMRTLLQTERSGLINNNAVSVRNHKLSSNIRVFPNPSNGLINIIGLQENTSIELRNSLGELIVLKAQNNGGNIQMELVDVAPGNYLLSVISDSEMSTHKIVITN